MKLIWRFGKQNFQDAHARIVKLDKYGMDTLQSIKLLIIIRH